MRVLCVIDCLGSGGAQRQLVNLAIGLKDRGHETSFLVYREEDYFKKLLDEAQIPVFALVQSNHIKRLVKMRRYIRSGNYDAVLSFLEAANFVCEIAGLPWRKWRLVVGERSTNPNILRSIKLRSYRLCHVWADYVAANSYMNTKLVRKINPLISAKKCHVIYNIVDLTQWIPPEDYMPRKGGEFKMLVAASHQYLKNLNGLVEAVSLLDTDEQQKLTIEWYGDEADSSKAEALKRINQEDLMSVFRFYPATLSISNKMQHADAIGLFSFYEGLPNAVCEGMACGKPIICSDVSDIPLLLSHSRELLFDPKDPLAIKNAISNLLKMEDAKLERIGQKNRDIAEQLFGRESILDRYCELLKK